MRQFSATIALSGSKYNEVRKSEITAPEIILLRAIHGGVESVHHIEEMDEVKRTAAEERARLTGLYGKAIASHEEIVGGIGALIGFNGSLPDDVPGLPEKGARKAVKKTDAPAEEPAESLEA